MVHSSYSCHLLPSVIAIFQRQLRSYSARQSNCLNYSKHSIFSEEPSHICRDRNMTENATAIKRALEDSDPRPPKRVKITDGASTAEINLEDAKESPELSVTKPSSIPATLDNAGEDSHDIQGDSSTKRKSMSKRRDSAGYPKSRKGKEKDGKNAGRRGRRGTRDDEVQAGASLAGEGDLGHNEQAEKAPRFPKRRCALLIGFCGSGCSGMQIQPNIRTIEGVLFDALVKAGAVSKDNADDPVKVGLSRAARTDAGVHAAGNVVSLKMIMSLPGVPDMVARINEELPPEIRLWGYVRVQNSFNPRVFCDSRRYTYFFPTYLLIPPKPGSGLDRTLKQYAASLSPVSSAHDTILHSFWATTGDRQLSTREDDLLRKRSWRMGSDEMVKLRELARKFEGTHNFHNFTIGRDFSDRSNQRHMKKIEITDPLVYGETEWISVLFHGQSFMLHQIRKMMFILILCCRTGTPSQVIDELYGPRVVFVPKMPSLGLLLERPIFDTYNARVAAINSKIQPSDPEYRPPIDFSLHEEAIEQFKKRYIYDNMRGIEDRDGLFDAWVRAVDAYSGSDLLYLNPRGIIPAVAVLKQGEKRENPFREKKRFEATSFPVNDEGNTMVLEEEDNADIPTDKSQLADMEG